MENPAQHERKLRDRACDGFTTAWSRTVGEPGQLISIGNPHLETDVELSEIQNAARDLVAGYKASGLSASDIAALLIFGLRAIAVDPETDSDTLAALASVRFR